MTPLRLLMAALALVVAGAVGFVATVDREPAPQGGWYGYVPAQRLSVEFFPDVERTRIEALARELDHNPIVRLAVAVADQPRLDVFLRRGVRPRARARLMDELISTAGVTGVSVEE